LHWITVSVFASVEFVKAWVADTLDWREDHWEAAGHGVNGFRELHRGMMGVRLGADPVVPSKSGDGYCTVWIPGQALDVVGSDCVVKAIAGLEASGVKWKCSRVDLAADTTFFGPYDVYRVWLDDEEARKWGDEPMVRSWVNRESYEYQQSGDGGSILRLGARQSERYMRVYLRGIGEAEGVYTRVELECKGKRADAVMHDLVAWDGGLAGRIVGHIRDFVEVDASWWQEFVKGVQRVGLVVVRVVEHSVERMFEWLRRQVAPSVACAVEVCGGDVERVVSMLLAGRGRWSKWHRELISRAEESSCGFGFGWNMEGVPCVSQRAVAC